MSWRGRFTPNVKQLIVYLNPKDPNCFGVRSWLRGNMSEIRQLNPNLNMSIQELSFGEPTLFVAYSFSDQRQIRLAGATEEETEDILKSISIYGEQHAISERYNNDGTAEERITNFGFAESFNLKIDNLPTEANGQQTSLGVDDPGQLPRMLTRNANFKIVN